MHSHPLLWDSRADSFLHDCFDADLHRKTLRSVRDAVLGTFSAQLASPTLAEAARARGLRPKHAIKQVDRLLKPPPRSRSTGSVVDGFCRRKTYRDRDCVRLDRLCKDDQSTLALSVIARDGRATRFFGRLSSAVEFSAMPSRMSFSNDSVQRFLLPFASRFWLIVDSPVKPCICFFERLRLTSSFASNRPSWSAPTTAT